MRCDAMRCDAMRCDAMRCDAMRCDAMRCDAMRCAVLCCAGTCVADGGPLTRVLFLLCAATQHRAGQRRTHSLLQRCCLAASLSGEVSMPCIVASPPKAFSRVGPNHFRRRVCLISRLSPRLTTANGHIAACAKECQSGTCIGPNVCLCPLGPNRSLISGRFCQKRTSRDGHATF
jgi:hypothetical protein